MRSEPPPDWTFETLKAFLLATVEGNDRRYAERFGAGEEAIEKANAATEKRFEGVNEFRAQLSDQSRTFMPRTETEVLMRSIGDRIDVITKLVEVNTRAIATINASRVGQQEGSRAVWGWIAGGFGLLFGIIAAIMAFAR